MKREFIDSLIMDYPEIFTTTRKWAIGNGWYEVLSELGAQLNKLPGKKIAITSIKEKYGFLDIDYSGRSASADALIQAASDKSETVCEVCGGPGSIDTKLSILACRCERCRLLRSDHKEILH